MNDTLVTPLKLGRLALIPKRPALRLADYLVTVPDHPIADPGPVLSWPMDRNDMWGDCVLAAYDHAAEAVHRALVGSYVNMSDAQLLADYRTQNPSFDPTGTPDANGNLPGDGGMVIQLYLEHLRKMRRILGFAQVDHTNAEEVKAAVYLFLAVITGETLTEANIDQFRRGQPWDVVEGSPAVGGHATCDVGYLAAGLILPVTWGALTEMTTAFQSKQVEEMWVPIFEAHVAHPGFRDGVDIAKLAADFKAITGDNFPTPPPAPTPPAPVDPRTTFETAARGWLAYRHSGRNRIFAKAVESYLASLTTSGHAQSIALELGPERR